MTEPGETKWSPNRGLDKLKSMPEAVELADYLTNEFRYSPRQSEALVIARIQELIDEHVKPLFEEADDILAELYESVRLFDIDPDTGEKVYRRYDSGRYVEDWSALPRQVGEAVVWGLQRVILELGSRASQFEMQMKFAYSVWDDEYHEHYQGPVEGTIQDRTASARRKSKDARYYYLYTHWLWRSVHDRVEALKETRRMLEFQLQRTTKQRNGREPAGGVYG